MTKVYLTISPVRLYKTGFFSKPHERRRISIGELARSFPTAPKITVYRSIEAAEEALKGLGYDSNSLTALTLEVELGGTWTWEALNKNNTQYTISFESISSDLISSDEKIKVVSTLAGRWNALGMPVSFPFKEIQDRIKLPFSHALDPTSTESGIACSWVAKDKAWQDTNISDRLVTEEIEEAFDENLDFLLGLEATFNILVGCHYPEDSLTDLTCDTGSKGVLDFLIFPLLARKLIAGTLVSEQNESHLINALAWTAAIPLEIMRFTAGIALTLLLAPIVAIVTLTRAVLPPIVAAVTHIKEELLGDGQTPSNI